MEEIEDKEAFRVCPVCTWQCTDNGDGNGQRKPGPAHEELIAQRRRPAQGDYSE